MPRFVHHRARAARDAGHFVPRANAILRVVPYWSLAFVLGLFAFFALVGRSTPEAQAATVACASPGLTLPRAVYVEPGVDAAIVEGAMAEWNAIRAGTFVRVADSADADVRVVPSTATWVDMPCGKLTSTVYVGNDVDLTYWLAHELGHTLGLADHITKGTNPARYINPGICPDDGYSGVMSYCSPRSEWWGPDDRKMMLDLFGPSPHAQDGADTQAHYEYRIAISGIARTR